LGKSLWILNYDLMKRLIILTLALAFLTFSCNTTKDNNIHVDHSKEKDQFKTHTDKKYKTKKHGGKTLKR